MGRLGPCARRHSGIVRQRPETERSRLRKRLVECERMADYHRREAEDWLAKSAELRYLLGVTA